MIQHYLPWIIVVGSVMMGLILQKIFVTYFAAIVKRTKWRWDDVVIESIGRFPLYWCLLGGSYALLSTTNGIDASHKQQLTRVVISLFIFTLTVVVARLVGSAVGAFALNNGGKAASTSLFSNGFRILIYLIGGIVILQNLNIQITPIVTALGLGGLAVALALEETLNNLFCGIQIVASRFVRIGDYVKLESGHEGYVTDIKARNTTICAFPDNNRIIVPNSKMASSIVINYSMPEKNLWVPISVGVSYDSDLDMVEKITKEVAYDICESIDGGCKDHEALFRYEEFGDSSINFTVRLYVKRFRDQFMIKHEFIKALHKRYAQENIDIPFPIRTVYMKDPT